MSARESAWLSKKWLTHDEKAAYGRLYTNTVPAGAVVLGTVTRNGTDDGKLLRRWDGLQWVSV